jgi:hypothetical protein
LSEETDIVHDEGSVPNCPFCGKPLEQDEDGQTCPHLVGTWNYWHSDNDLLEDAADGATSFLSWTSHNAGETLYFLKED